MSASASASASLPKKKDWKMEYTSLGGSGLQVSRLGFGTMTFTTFEQAKELLEICVKYGINYFDNAEVYGDPCGNCEVLFGKALCALQKEDPYLYRRSDLVITTKLFFAASGHPQNRQGVFNHDFFGINERGSCRKKIIEGMDGSLKRLQLDYVDVIYAHRYDPLTPVLEVVRAFTDLIISGKAHYWGTSMWPSSKIIEAYYLAERHGLIAPIVEQPKYSMFDRDYMESHYLPVFCHPYNIGTTTWNALDAGLLTGKYNKQIEHKDTRRAKGQLLSVFYGDIPEWKLEKVAQLQPIAKRLNTSVSNLAVAWCLKNKNVSVVLLGARDGSQLEETCKAIKVIDQLTDSIMQEIEDILKNKPVPDPVIYANFLRTPNARL